MFGIPVALEAFKASKEVLVRRPAPPVIRPFLENKRSIQGVLLAVSRWDTSAVAVTTLRCTFYYTRAQSRALNQNRTSAGGTKPKQRKRKKGRVSWPFWHSENPKGLMFASLRKKFKRICHKETLENCITTHHTHDYKIYHHFVTGNKWQCSNF